MHDLKNKHWNPDILRSCLLVISYDKFSCSVKYFVNSSMNIKNIKDSDENRTNLLFNLPVLFPNL